MLLARHLESAYDGHCAHSGRITGYAAGYAEVTS